MTKTVLFLTRFFSSRVLKIEKWSWFLIVLALAHSVAYSQVPKAVVPAPKAAPEQPPPAAPQTIPIADIAIQAEAALARVRQLENKSRIDDLIDTANDEIPVLARNASYRTWEMRQLLTNNTALEAIRTLEEEWRDIGLRASALTRDLTRAVVQLDRDIEELETLGATWEATGKAAVEAAAPPEVLDRVKDVSSAIAAAKKQVLDERATVLGLQSRSADIGARAAEARKLLAQASERAVTRLLYRDSLPLWNAGFWRAAADSFSLEIRANLSGQSSVLTEYLGTHERNLAFHALLFLGLVAALSVARTKINCLCENDENLQRSKKVYDMPVVSAMLIAILVSAWFYPRPPRALWILISMVGAAPALVFARRVIDSSLYPMLYVIVGFYLVDRVRAFFAPLPVISRLMFLIEALVIMLFLLRTLRLSAPQADAPPHASQPAWRVIRFGSRLALFVVAVALLSNVGGYVRLADLIVHTATGSAYTALVLYALTRVGEGLVQGLLYVPPISLLGMVKRHKMLVTRRINRWLKWIAFLSWLGLTLHTTGLLQPLIAFMQSARKASVSIGSLTLSVENVFSFFFIIWASYILSRFTRFVLEEEVYPNIRLDRGLPYAVSTMLHYVLLLSGLVLALGAIGVDMTKFTIVAGAFSVGIGFGLQNIVNNFVSGLIVLFERPIKVGDTIQIDDVVGRVQHIGIRASIVRSTTGAEVIIPNGKLISDKVTNWTLSNQLRQIVVPVITKSDINVAQFKKLLLEIAQRNKLVVPTPAPEALFIKRGIDTFEFELRVWTGDLDAWLEVKSDLITEINEALRQNEMAAREPTSAVPGAA